MTDLNHQLRLTSRPRGLPRPDDFELTTEPLPEPGDGEILVGTEMISIDPAMRGWMDDAPSYLPPVQLGEVMRANAAGVVLASRNRRFAAGDCVVGPFGLQEHALCDGRGVRRIDLDQAPLPAHLGVLGSTGLTAYFGLLEIGRPRPGDTVLVSAAAGATGSVAGQIAKLCGCRVVGIAGGGEKCRHLVEHLGFHAAIDHRAGGIDEALERHAPDGVDVYFDNVGGPILDAALLRLARGARVVVCGAISQYNAIEGWSGPASYWQLLVRRASMSGFLVFDYAERYPEALRRLASWIAAGKIVSREHVIDGGVGDFPEVLAKLFAGENTGKLLLRLAPRA